MAHHAPVSGSPGDAAREDSDRGVGVRAPYSPRPPQVEAALDGLFLDADQHGPRWPVIARRAIPASLLLPATVALAAWVTWRSFVIDAFAPRLADMVLVAPALIAIVVLAAVLAPLARISMAPLLASAALLGVVSGALVAAGSLVVATMPGAFAAMLLGLAVARFVRRAVWALPLLLAAGVSDAQSVNGGITQSLLGDNVGGGAMPAQIEPVLVVSAASVTLLDYLVLHVPAATGMWVLGLVDVVALGLLLGLTHLFWLPVPRTAIALGAVLVATIGFGIPIPVLPMLGVAWALVHARLVWRSTRFSVRRLLYLGG